MHATTHMILAWSAALLAQSALFFRTRGAVGALHGWQALSGFLLMGVYLWLPEWYGWAYAAWWVVNAGVLVWATDARTCWPVSISAWLVLMGVAVGSSVHFDGWLLTTNGLRWIISTVAISHWIGAAWPDRWMQAYAALSYAHALAQAWVWLKWPEMYLAHQWAQAVLFSIWAISRRKQWAERKRTQTSDTRRSIAEPSGRPRCSIYSMMRPSR